MKTKIKVLIIGGAGFIGYFCSRALAKMDNYKITIIDNLSRGQYDNEFESLTNLSNTQYIQGDITELRTFTEAGYDFDYIYNFAAVIGVKNVENNPDKVLYVNSISMLNLFEYAKNLPHLKKILFSSTSEIYSGTLRHSGIDIPTAEDVHLTIDDISSNRSTYALSKMFGESISHIYGRKYNIPFTIVRYHNIYGPRMGFAHVIPEMFIKINADSEVLVPSASHTRSFCYIDDAVNMTIASVEAEESDGETFHIGNQNEEIMIRDLVEMISSVMGKPITIIEKQATLGSPTRRVPNVRKINKLIKNDPRVKLYDGLSATYKWYKNKLHERWE
jgi:UDP-glucose 4-epimerase